MPDEKGSRVEPFKYGRMSTWTPYPHAEGHYATWGPLVLTAWPNGTWSVWLSKSGAIVDPRASCDPREAPLTNMEEAKKRAEVVAAEMLEGTPRSKCNR